MVQIIGNDGKLIELEPIEGSDLDGDLIVAARYLPYETTLNTIEFAELEFISAVERLFERYRTKD